MKRFLKSTSAFGLAFSLIGAPLAMAQDQHGPQQSGNHGPAPQHVTVQHQTVQRVTVQHETVQHASSHPPGHNASGWNHLAPPPPQHMGFNGNGGHQWHSGDHYNGSRNYVTNYNSYHLSPPPSGHRWVQDNGQFVLIAVATGVISSVILNAASQ